GTAAGNDISGVKERTDHALQSVSFDERVGVHRADELTASEAQTNVQRVSFAAVLLVDDDESRIRRRPVKRTDGLRRDVPLVNRLHGNEIELLDQYVHGSILGAIADYDHFQTWILQRQQCAETHFDRRFFVVGRRENGNRR